LPVWAPSPVADPLFREVPKELTVAEIGEVVAGYATVAGHCAEGGGSEVLMQVTRSLSARIRKWLGLLGRRPAKVPYGAGAWGR